MTVSTAELADIPKSPNELEDYVSALFHASGYFVEKNITERDFTEILELDAVATSYEADPPSSTIAEAKSGGWGFSDIFKVVGWMQYLKLPKGAFFVSKPSPGLETTAIQAKFAPVNVAFIDLGDFSQAAERFEAAGFQKVLSSFCVDVWRFSSWAERRLIQKLRAPAKDPAKNGPRAALEYHRLINDGVFFIENLVERLAQLYAAYQQHPKLSLGVAIEMAGGQYDPDSMEQNNPLIREALLHGKHDLLQACFYLEHRARLSILKTAVDLVCAAGSSDPSLGKLIPALPWSFREGLAWLRAQPSFRRYALFWQVFLWGCGGFLLKSHEEMERAWLSQQTGVPVGEIPNALRAFDMLFPFGGSWLQQLGSSDCVVVKMVPAAFRGIGAYHRRCHYGCDQYRKLGCDPFTIERLVDWNNCGVRLLAPSPE